LHSSIPQILFCDESEKDFSCVTFDDSPTQIGLKLDCQDRPIFSYKKPSSEGKLKLLKKEKHIAFLNCLTKKECKVSCRFPPLPIMPTFCRCCLQR
jgi:hypothetical protein